MYYLAVWSRRRSLENADNGMDSGEISAGFAQYSSGVDYSSGDLAPSPLPTSPPPATRPIQPNPATFAGISAGAVIVCIVAAFALRHKIRACYKRQHPPPQLRDKQFLMAPPEDKWDLQVRDEGGAGIVMLSGGNQI
eukprot:CAMPEP_0119321538 /NCGR_PEP_ID=MMETSP1333-20130426/55676_1 /TAXON_ID=418940 /ORGANISM="Scyphosphaera apsteinii, Strain RCC1455" /LENGTH=136 /DNA_ID=CAMNT_0007328537 /DNA_START=88 /DNA_END=498 /DNA_ORIENTATION=+